MWPEQSFQGHRDVLILLACAKVVTTHGIGVEWRQMVCTTVQWKPTAPAIFLRKL